MHIKRWDRWDPWDLAVAGLRGPGRRPDLPTAAGSLAASLQGGDGGDGGGLGVWGWGMSDMKSWEKW